MGEFTENFKKLTKTKLVEMICSLKVEKESLRQINENINESLLKINKRMEDLERRENVNLQYNRRN